MEPLSITAEMESAVVSTVIARRTTGEYELASDDTTYLRTGCAVAQPITDSVHARKPPARRLISRLWIGKPKRRKSNRDGGI